MKIKIRVDEEERYVIVCATATYDDAAFCGTVRAYGNLKAQGTAGVAALRTTAIERMWDDVRGALKRGLSAASLMVGKQTNAIEIEEE